MVSFQKESSMVSDAIDRMINTTTSTNNTNNNKDRNKETFVPCSTFQGSKEGYYFGTTVEQGPGYYLDSTNKNNNNNGHQSKRKSAVEDNNDTTIQKKKRSVRFTDDAATSTSSGSGVVMKPKRKTGEEMLAEIEKSMAEEDRSPKIMGQLDAAGIKSAAYTLQKMFQKNQLKRAQYPEEPEQFMESELALNDEIESLKAIATNLPLYPLFIKLILPSLQILLSHENVDIALAVIALLVELLDPALLLQSSSNDSSTTSQKDSKDNNKNNHKYMKQLVDETMEYSSIDLIISNLGRLDVTEEEEAVGIENILTLVENALDLERTISLMQPNEDDINATSIVSSLLSNTLFLSWLFHRISQTTPATNENVPLYLHITEILATILQHNDAHLQDISSLKPFTSAFEEDEINPPKKDAPQTQEGIEILLQSIAMYRKRNPQTEVECECLENTFDALSASLLHNPTNLSKFLEAQGIELMLRCIREKVHSGHGSLKILYFCLSSSESSSEGKQSSYQYTKQACETFVDVGGLKYLFPLLMGRKSSLPKPAKCSDAGSDLSKRKNNHPEGDNDMNKEKKLGKLAKLAVSARKDWIQQIETHAIQIVYYLTLHLDQSSQHDTKSRLLAKFLEDEKCDKLIDLCLKYDEKMRLAEYKFYRSDEAEELEENGLEVDLAALDAKLKGGGDLFYRIGAIIAFMCTGSKRCHERVLKVLKEKDSGIGVVNAAIEGFISILDDNKQKKQLQTYLDVV